MRAALDSRVLRPGAARGPSGSERDDARRLASGPMLLIERQLTA